MARSGHGLEAVRAEMQEHSKAAPHLVKCDGCVMLRAWLFRQLRGASVLKTRI